MGSKGDRAAKEPLAMKLYADGQGLTEISRRLDISDTTLRRWKEDSRVPGKDIDGWDRQRQQKRSHHERIQTLYDRQMAYIEGLQPSEVSSAMMDVLSKMAALIERWNKAERALSLMGKVRNELSEEKNQRPDEVREEARRRLVDEVDSILGVR